ncbi:MAG: hypothetical protein RL039_1980 [Pseudomonadota bacterium]|jgi:uncharacterized membrane protein YsdA (DUF1294 family)/cold shock CspA family protein
MQIEGRLQTWNDERGFGFIEPRQGGQPLFAHISDFPHGTGRPTVGQVLHFEVKTGPNGKKRAHAIQYPARSAAQVREIRAETPAPWTAPRLLLLPLFAGLWFFVASRWGVTQGLGWVYAALSLVTFFAYAFDKSAARAGTWRTSENTLHTLGLIGGWPGALLAQQLLRHKTAKTEFASVFWVTATLNMAAFVVWHSGIYRPI